jgi:hypothetical protein
MDSISKYEENKEYYENLDKRTKEYKNYRNWKENQEAASKGLGDSLEKVFEATGIADAVKFIAGEDCGCLERKAKLNKLLPFRNPECFTEEEYLWLSDLFEKHTNVVDRTTQQKLVDTYNRVFHKKQRLTSCGSCIRRVYNDLKTYFDKYNS